MPTQLLVASYSSASQVNINFGTQIIWHYIDVNNWDRVADVFYGWAQKKADLMHSFLEK